jgi:PPOX class probable F420-dependent enzyme
VSIPQRFHDLFEKRTFAHVATVMPDGTPQVTPVWVDYDADADHVLVNTATGRQKERNLRREGKAGVSMIDPDDPYRWVSVRGPVAEITTEGAVEHIHELSRRYTGEDYGNLDDEGGDRVVVRIAAERVATS